MKGVLRLFLAAVFAVSLAGAAAADERADMAKALVEKAIAHYKTVGKDQAFADFMNKDGEFVEGEYYVIVADAETGAFKTHAINPKLIDNPKLWDLRDMNGVYIIRDMVASGKKAPDGGWTEYTWTHPETKKLSPKRTFVKVHDGYLFMVGYYTD